MNTPTREPLRSRPTPQRVAVAASLRPLELSAPVVVLALLVLLVLLILGSTGAP